MSVRIVFVLFAGPEMPCKLQHAFLFARDVAQKGGNAKIVFEGNSPKWLTELANPQHKMAKLFDLVKQEGLIAGVCQACATMHNALEVARAHGLPLLSDAFGHVSLVPFMEQGYSIVTL